MRFAVIELRRRGVRLTSGEMREADPRVGNLQILDFAPSIEKRPLRRAELKTATPTHPTDLLVPLFEPQLVRMAARWFVLRGWQIESSKGVTAQYAQEWLVRQADG